MSEHHSIYWTQPLSNLSIIALENVQSNLTGTFVDSKYPE